MHSLYLSIIAVLVGIAALEAGIILGSVPQELPPVSLTCDNFSVVLNPQTRRWEVSFEP